MQLFTRRHRMAGPRREVLPYVTDMCGFECEITGREVSLWTSLLGSSSGTWYSTMAVEGVTEVAEAIELLAADNAYQTLVSAGRQFVVEADTHSLATVTHGELSRAEVGSFARVTSAEIAAGHEIDALTLAFRRADAATAATGLEHALLCDEYGSASTLRWVALAGDAAAIEQADNALRSDADHWALTAGAQKLIVDGSWRRVLLSRVA